MTNNTLTLGRIDFAPLTRFVVGFDDMFDEIMRVQESQANQSNYPPYNIIRYDNNDYAIELAIAGFAYSDIDISVEGNILVISGEKSQDKPAGEYIYKGISQRGFRRTFTLGNYNIVKDAIVKNGMLTVKIERIIPESMKPKKIAITSGD